MAGLLPSNSFPTSCTLSMITALALACGFTLSFLVFYVLLLISKDPSNAGAASLAYFRKSLIIRNSPADSHPREDGSTTLRMDLGRATLAIHTSDVRDGLKGETSQLQQEHAILQSPGQLPIQQELMKEVIFELRKLQDLAGKVIQSEKLKVLLEQQRQVQQMQDELNRQQRVMLQQLQQKQQAGVSATSSQDQQRVRAVPVPKAGRKSRDGEEGALDDEEKVSWTQQTFSHYNSSGFVQFSAYRISRHRVAIIGLAERDKHNSRKLEGCEWQNESQENRSKILVKGQLEIIYCGEHHELKYETVVLLCNLDGDIGTGGGKLKATLNDKTSVMFQEPYGTQLEIGQPPFKYELAYCGLPLYGDINGRLLKEWLEYHRIYIDTDHFVFYDLGGFSQKVLDAIHSFMQQGIVTITPFHGISAYETWSNALALTMHDCAYNMRDKARWVFSQDVDEFLVLQPPQSLKHLLNMRYSNMSWITHGCQWFSTELCSEEDMALMGDELQESYIVSSLQYRWPGFYCTEKSSDPLFCVSHMGYRKIIINPRKTYSYYNHAVGLFDGEGVDVSAEDMRHMHYRSAAAQNSALCNKTADSWWIRDSTIRDIVGVILSCKKDPKPHNCAVQTLNATRHQ